MDLYNSCMRMASENKITAKNTWSLGLIDHISELVKPSAEEGSETNFQRASCTLDAGVKIYSYRVDSVHSEVFKLLGGMTRAGPAPAQEAEAAGDDGEEGTGEDEEGGAGEGKKRRKARAIETDPSKTLADPESMNVKKFDLAFAVDPLFRKTSAQFDAGGARGLLLNNLSVYNGCHILFDSLEAPDAQAAKGEVAVGAQMLDVSGLVDPEAIANLVDLRISPRIDEIESLLGSKAPAPEFRLQAHALVEEALRDLGETLALEPPRPSGRGAQNAPAPVAFLAEHEEDPAARMAHGDLASHPVEDVEDEPGATFPVEADSEQAAEDAAGVDYEYGGG